ncbi:hypothetical protein AVEN_49811-1 [Araneus ventricosus]|uniref:Uncharacterized protein n=1 Tax=Araneus ventricosus TaxID=182803 RepID=A0A4Y2JMY8_ARAVE|nr:hypothetical protein AVEN_49811-1 [Araneus ventricosus]
MGASLCTNTEFLANLQIVSLEEIKELSPIMFTGARFIGKSYPNLELELRGISGNCSDTLSIPKEVTSSSKQLAKADGRKGILTTPHKVLVDHPGFSAANKTLASAPSHFGQTLQGTERTPYYRTPSPCLHQLGYGQDWEGPAEKSTIKLLSQPRERTRRPRDARPRACKLGARYVETLACPSSSTSVRH